MANEKRLIDANELAEQVDNLCADWNENWIGNDNQSFILHSDVSDLISDAPTVDTVEVVHGRWERCGGDLHSSGYAIYCSVCNKTHFVHYKHSLGGLYGCKELFEKPKYCPSCGAFMEVEE